MKFDLIFEDNPISRCYIKIFQEENIKLYNFDNSIKKKSHIDIKNINIVELSIIRCYVYEIIYNKRIQMRCGAQHLPRKILDTQSNTTPWKPF